MVNADDLKAGPARTIAAVGLVMALVPFVVSLRSTGSTTLTVEHGGGLLQHVVQAQTFDYVAVPLGVLAAACGVLALLGVARANEASPQWKQRAALMALGAGVLGLYQALHGVGMVAGL